MSHEISPPRSTTATAPGDSLLRRLWFAFLERVLLPPGLWILRRWLRTCRCVVDDRDDLERLLAADHAIAAALHGSMLHLLALALGVPSEQRRRLFVLLSASLDGHLLAETLAGFGIDHAVGAAGEHGSLGGRSVIRRVRSRQIAVIAVDGPTGPAGIAKPGLGLLARAAHADVYVLRTHANRGIHLPSWDRCHLPLPYSEVRISIDRLPSPDHGQWRDLHLIAQEILARTGGARRDGDATGSMPSSADAPRTTAPGAGR